MLKVKTPEKIVYSGIIHTGISDPSLVFAIKKIRVIKKGKNTYEKRNIKNKVSKWPFIFLAMTQMTCGSLEGTFPRSIR